MTDEIAGGAMEPVQGAENPLAIMIGRAIEAKPRADDLMRASGNVPVVITDAKMAGDVGQLIKMIRSHAKTLEDERKAIVGPIGEGVKRINARFKFVTDPLKAAEAELGNRNTAFLNEQRRLAQEEEDRLRTEQADKALEDAAKLEAEGKDEEAAEVLDEAVDGVAPIVQEVKTVRGDYGATTGLRDFWCVEVVDKSKLPAEFLMPDMVALTQTVRRADNPLREIPGCRIWNDPKAVTR